MQYIYIIYILSHSISYSTSHGGLDLQGERWWPRHSAGFIQGSTHPQTCSDRPAMSGNPVKASCSEVSQPVTQGTGLAVWLPDIKSSMRTCRKTAQGCGPVNSVISSIQWIHILYLSSCLPALKVFFIVLYSNVCYASVIMILLRRQPLLNLIFCHSIIVSQTGKIQIRLEQCILKMRLKNRLLFETDV